MTRVVDFEETTFSTRSRGVLPAFGPQISESGRATHSLAPEKPGWPPTFTCPLTLAQRLTPHAPPAGSGRAQTLPRWLLPSTDRRIDKDRTGPDLDERSVHIQYVTEFQYVTKPGNFFGEINPFLPACLRRSLTIRSGLEALKASGSRRACQRAISHNDYSLIALPDFPEFAQAVRYSVPGTRLSIIGGMKQESVTDGEPHAMSLLAERLSGRETRVMGGCHAIMSVPAFLGPINPASP